LPTVSSTVPDSFLCPVLISLTRRLIFLQRWRGQFVRWSLYTRLNDVTSQHNSLYIYKVLKEKIMSNSSWLLMITMLVIKTLMIMVIRKRVKRGNQVAESQAARATVIQGIKMMSRSAEALSSPHHGFLTLSTLYYLFLVIPRGLNFCADVSEHSVLFS
jgi:ABC-type microcin C transport system permease subunit YejE